MASYQGTTTLEVLQDAKRYNAWIAETFLPHLKAPTIEIGSGLGNITKFFVHIDPLFVTDVDKTLLREARRLFGNRRNVTIQPFNVVGVLPRKFLGYFSTVASINVLEHISDDRKALQHMYNMLKNDGNLLLLVPAKMSAYTRYDKALGHYRRYEREELREKLVNVGFEVTSLYYFNFIGLFSWVIRDRFERRNVQLKPYQISLFDSIVPVLRKIESIVKPPLGISLIAIAKKTR